MDSEARYRPSDLLRFVDLGGGALVPGSSAVVYVANTLDGETASKDTALWVSDAAGIAVSPRRTPPSRGRRFSHGTLVAFLKAQSDTDGNDATQSASARWRRRDHGADLVRPRNVAGLSWSPDGQHLAVDASDAPRRDPEQAYRVTRPIWRMDGMGLVEDRLTDIFVVPATGGQPHQLTSAGGVISFLDWSRTEPPSSSGSSARRAPPPTRSRPSRTRTGASPR